MIDLTRQEPSSHPGPTGFDGRDRVPAESDVGKPCAGEPQHDLTGGGWKRAARTVRRLNSTGASISPGDEGHQP